MPFKRKKPAAIGTKAPFPGFIAPALASSIGKAPAGERWIHEIKFDGYRAQVHLANETIKVFTRKIDSLIDESPVGKVVSITEPNEQYPEGLLMIRWAGNDQTPKPTLPSQISAKCQK